MKQIGILFFIIWSIVIFLSCHNEELGQPPIESQAPGPVKVLDVKPTPGGAIISYELPADKDIMCVRAEYMRNGKLATAAASMNNTSLEIQGLPPYTAEVNVQLITVDNSRNESSPVSVKITPLESPVVAILESFEASATFGGFNAKWINETKAEIGIKVMHEVDGIYLDDGTYYSNKDTVLKLFDGYESELTKFKVYITDKWGNRSDDIYFELKPYFLVKLDGNNFEHITFPGDVKPVGYAPFEYLFDGSNIGSYDYVITDVEDEYPAAYSWDMKENVKLYRYKQWDIKPWAYSENSHIKWEIYGAVDYKKGMDEEYWDPGKGEWRKDWVFLGYYEAKKPSGKGFYEAPTAEDVEYALEGVDFYFPEAEPVRYIRYLVYETYTGRIGFACAELAFWGDNNF